MAGAGLYLDLSYAFVDRFVAEEHEVLGNTISGCRNANHLQ
jgi:hypothetical protein